jgi:hypothetical protein
MNFIKKINFDNNNVIYKIYYNNIFYKLGSIIIHEFIDIEKNNENLFLLSSWNLSGFKFILLYSFHNLLMIFNERTLHNFNYNYKNALKILDYIMEISIFHDYYLFENLTIDNNNILSYDNFVNNTNYSILLYNKISFYIF